MSLLSRRLRLPGPLRSRLESHERVVALADAGDTWVAATQLGLWLPQTEPDGSQGSRRIGWHHIVKASWSDGRLEVIEGEFGDDGVVIDQEPISVALTEPRNVPAVVRTRVEASIARSEQVTVPGGTGRIVARRVPGVDGLTWTARLDSTTPPSPAAYETLAECRRRAAAAGRG